MIRRSLRYCLLALANMLGDDNKGSIKMSKNILFNFDDPTSRNDFYAILVKCTNLLEGKDAVALTNAIERMTFDVELQNANGRNAAVYVSGTKIAEGLLPQMRQRFNSEIGSHSASVELRETRNGREVIVQSRRFQ